MGRLRRLAKECERDTGDAFVLNKDIYEAVTGEKAVFTKWGYETQGGFNVPNYTGVVEAAMSLIPRGLQRTDMMTGPNESHATIYKEVGRCPTCDGLVRAKGWPAFSHAPTLPRAIAAAALRAIALIENEEDDD